MAVPQKELNMFLGIMAFYVLLSHVIFPAIFFFFIEKTLTSAGNGFIVGSLISILLWLVFGSKMVK
jgi:hypothetical protein